MDTTSRINQSCSCCDSHISVGDRITTVQPIDLVDLASESKLPEILTELIANVYNQQANISALKKAGLAAFRHVDSAAMAAAVSAVCAAEYQPPPTLQIGAEGAEKILAAILAKR